jgi:hypothetical protein
MGSKEFVRNLKRAGNSINPPSPAVKKYHRSGGDELEIANIILNTGASEPDNCSPHRDTSSSYSSSDSCSSDD